MSAKTKELKEKGSGIAKEFKEFISRGNVIDLAVGVIIGEAFGKIVASLVKHIIMPLVGIIIGGLDFSNLAFKVGKAKLKYGLFIQNVIDFLIVAACIFVFVKVINKVIRKPKKEEAPAVNEELETLKEIRDLLKKKK